MHLQVILAFALLLWWPDPRPAEAWIKQTWAVMAFVWAFPLAAAIASAVVSRLTRSALPRGGDAAQRALLRYHRAALLIRVGLLVGIGASLYFTLWPELLSGLPVLRSIPGADRLAVLAPYFVGLVAAWWLLYPVEKRARDLLLHGTSWSRRQYIMFNLRHQLLIVAIPLTLILAAFDLSRDHQDWFIDKFGTPLAGDLLIGATATAVFVFAPFMLRHIWTTSPLPDSTLRRKLISECDRIGLRVREILVWHSDHMLVNAAVMGVAAPLRYILLSDALLETMSDEEIEAVFGHEAGHVRRHHLPYFLLFAFVSMLVVSGVMELVVVLSGYTGQPLSINSQEVQAAGVLAVVPLWGLLFGWISRTFERQADVFGAFAAAPVEESHCKLPCAVHSVGSSQSNAVCATGAQVFVGALRKVANVNGIPIRERSWRHGSIASRIQVLTRLASDPNAARRFHRRVNGIKLGMVLTVLLGLAFALYYIWHHPVYHKDIVRGVIEPVQRLFGDGNS